MVNPRWIGEHMINCYNDNNHDNMEECDDVDDDDDGVQECGVVNPSWSGG